MNRAESVNGFDAEVLAHVRAMQKRFDVLLIEGAGGLLSPLGENFDSGDLIAALGALPLVVARTGLARSTTFC
jgi:dethiobiotin synthetase